MSALAPWVSVGLTASLAVTNLFFAVMAWKAKADLAELKLWVSGLVSDLAQRLAVVETAAGIYSFHRHHSSKGKLP